MLHDSEPLESLFGKLASKVYFINQGYLHCGKSLTVRLRKQRGRRGKIKYVLAVKRKTKPGRIIEIEKKISEADFRELADGAVGWLNKVRYIVEGWDVDFFKDGQETYFVMAEFEMPDGAVAPAKLPDFIADNLIYLVPREDCRFSSKKLSDIEYAKRLLGVVGGGVVENTDSLAATAGG